MILYIRCNCGQNKVIANRYKALGYEVKVLNLNPLYRKEVKSYGAKLPFTVVNDKVTEL